MRIGEALGLRHEDIAAAEREVTVFPRHNVNGARTKSANTRTIPVSAELVRLYADYLHEEYGDLTPVTYSSTCGAARTAARWPIRRSMTWSAGCAARPASISTRTGIDTPLEPG